MYYFYHTNSLKILKKIITSANFKRLFKDGSPCPYINYRFNNDQYIIQWHADKAMFEIATIRYIPEFYPVPC